MKECNEMAPKCYTLAYEQKTLKNQSNSYQDALVLKNWVSQISDHAFTIVYLGLGGDDHELELNPILIDHGPCVVGDGFAHIALQYT